MKFNRKMVAAVTALGLVGGAASTAWAADLDTSVASLGTDVSTPSTVEIGPNDFSIRVWATGNLTSAQTATVVTDYTMGTNGAITPVTTETMSLPFAGIGNYSNATVCPATNAPKGCASNPHLVPATLTVATGAADGLTGTLTISHVGGAHQLSTDATPARGYVSVSAPVVNPCATRTAPAAPAIELEFPAASTGWYNAATGVPTMSVVPAANAQYLALGDNAWSPYSSPVKFAGQGSALTFDARSVLPATDACSALYSSPVRETLKIDVTAPSAPLAGVSPAPNAAGWNNSAATVTFTSNGDDGTSGIASCTSPVVVSEETTSAGESVSGTCTDRAGNTSLATSKTIKLDMTPPISSVTGVTGGVYATAPTASCSATDNLSTVATHGSVASTPETPTAGSNSVTCNGATDRAGNTQTVASAPVSYTLAPIGGFNGNFDSTTNVLRVKPNQAIPLKWAFSDGVTNHALLSGGSILTQNSTRCTQAEGADGAETAETTAGSSGLQLLEADRSYQMNWKASSTTGCRAITVTMNFIGGGSTTRTILVNIQK